MIWPIKEARVIRDQGKRVDAVHMSSRPVKSDMEPAPKGRDVGELSMGPGSPAGRDQPLMGVSEHDRTPTRTVC